MSLNNTDSFEEAIYGEIAAMLISFAEKIFSIKKLQKWIRLPYRLITILLTITSCLGGAYSLTQLIIHFLHKFYEKPEFMVDTAFIMIVLAIVFLLLSPIIYCVVIIIPYLFCRIFWTISPEAAKKEEEEEVARKKARIEAQKQKVQEKEEKEKGFSTEGFPSIGKERKPVIDESFEIC